VTVVHIPASRLHPEPVPDDDEHAGPARSAYALAWRSADGGLEVGVWEFEGEQRTMPRHGLEQGYEEITTLTAGRLDVEVDGASHELTAGDTIVYDCPIGAKRLVSPGWKGVYVVRRRPPDAPAPGRVVALRVAETALEEQPLDADGHSGDARSELATTYTSGDERVQVGLWRLSGHMGAEPQDGYEEVLVLLEGSLRVALDRAVYDLEAGDVLVYDCPIGAKELDTPGALVHWVVRYRG
jgi:quercetin dioxygenase-like cupin family protein